MTSKTNRPQDFAAKLEELEKIVLWFEQSEIDVAEGLKQFERGSKLAADLRQQLSDVEEKVKTIQAKL